MHRFRPIKVLAVTASWMRKFHRYNIRENTASAEAQMPSQLIDGESYIKSRKHLFKGYQLPEKPAES